MNFSGKVGRIIFLSVFAFHIAHSRAGTRKEEKEIPLNQLLLSWWGDWNYSPPDYEPPLRVRSAEFLLLDRDGSGLLALLSVQEDTSEVSAAPVVITGEGLRISFGRWRREKGSDDVSLSMDVLDEAHIVRRKGEEPKSGLSKRLVFHGLQLFAEGRAFEPLETLYPAGTRSVPSQVLSIVCPVLRLKGRTFGPCK